MDEILSFYCDCLRYVMSFEMTAHPVFFSLKTPLRPYQVHVDFLLGAVQI